VIELRNVSYRYPGYSRHALESIDLALGDGEIVGLVGANESGKSTLCLVASGLAPAAVGGELTGDVLVGGSPIRGQRPHELAGRVGLVFQSPAAQRSGITASVFEEVALGPINLGLPLVESVERARGALDGLGLGGLAERDPSRLSGGETQLVAIAAVLALQPEHLILDEPVAELDPDGTARVVEALRALAGAGTTLLIAEHRTDVLAELCTRIVAIDGGRIALDGPTGQTLADPVLDRIGVRRPPAAAVR